MQKVQDKSVSTDASAESLLNGYERENYSPTKEEEEKVSFVRKRFEQMDTKRSIIHKNWSTYQKQYEAIFRPYPDGRSASNVPLERAIIELFVAEAIKRPTRFNVKAVTGFEKQAKALDKVWKYDWEAEKRNNEIIDNEYITAIFGTGIIYTGYEMKSRIIEDFDDVADDGKITYAKKLQSKSNVFVRNFDIRHFWIDERAHTADEAVDCIAEEYLTEEEYYNLRFDKNFRNIASEKAQFLYHSDRYSYVTKEERADGTARYVKLRHYWNQQLDKYMVVANDRVVIRESPILNASHKLPFVVRQYGRNVFSIYGYGLCEALMTFKSDVNTIREMLMDAIKRSNQQTIAIGNGLTFDGNSFAYDNTIMKFKGNLAGNFQQLSGNPPNAAIFNYLDRLYKDIAIYTGIDIQNILGDPQQTAYQTAVQKESSLQRVNVVLKNRDAAFEKLADLHKDNLQMFYPLKLVRQLVPLDDNDDPKEEIEPEYPKIELENEEYKGGRFVKSEKGGLFEVKPDLIRGSVKIDVYTDLNAPTINEVEKAQKMDFFNTVANITNAYSTNPELNSIIPMKKTIRDMAESLNMEVETTDTEELKQAQQGLMDELASLMPGSSPTAPQPIEQAQPQAQTPQMQPEMMQA